MDRTSAGEAISNGNVSKFNETIADLSGSVAGRICGRYMFIFQPAEEGVRGAFAFRHQWNFGKIDELYCCHIGFAPEDTFVAGAKGFLATSKFDVTLLEKALMRDWHQSGDVMLYWQQRRPPWICRYFHDRKQESHD